MRNFIVVVAFALILRQLNVMREDNAANTPELKAALAERRQKQPVTQRGLLAIVLVSAVVMVLVLLANYNH